MVYLGIKKQKIMKKNKKHYLITGGLGFIGSAIANHLIKKNLKLLFMTIYPEERKKSKKFKFFKIN